MTGTQLFEPSSEDSASPDPWLGCVVGGRYRIEERIGHGGMGVVYRGQHLELGKRVAIKRLDPSIAKDPTAFERFRREAIAASRIESPHVVHVFDWGKADDGSPYLVMELLAGNDLRWTLQNEGRLVAEQAVTVAAQVLRALVRTHATQIVHRDLKPENVFLCRYDADEIYVKLLDFGISKSVVPEPDPHTVTRRGVILGTACYMSPEQARGEPTLDSRSDLYSVGSILYEALTGQPPHRGRTYEATLVDICTRDADDVRLHAPLVPEALARVVTRALERDVTRRFQSAREFLDALSNAVPEAVHRVSENPESALGTPVPQATPSPQATPGPNAVQVPTPQHADGGNRPNRVRWLAVGISSFLFVSATLGMLLHARRPTPTEVPAMSALATEPQRNVAPFAAPSIAAAPSPMTSPAAALGMAGARAIVAPSIGRAPTRHPSTVPSPANSATSDSAGVAPGLKLRRSMP